MDKFDKIFIDRVEEVFNNHQEEYNPADWKNLQNKMSKKKRGLVIFLPQLAKAASIILFIGLSVYTLNNYNSRSISLNNEPDKSLIENNLITQIDTSKKSTEEKVLIPNNKSNESDFKSANQQKTFEIASNNDNKGEIHVEPNIIIVDSMPEGLQNEEVLITKNDTSKIKLDVNRFERLKEALDKHHEEIVQLDTNKAKNNTKNMTLEEYNNIPIAEDEQKTKKRFDFGVEVASVSNYAKEGSTDGLNIGGGLTAAYKISDKFSIETGAFLAKNSINLSDQNTLMEKAYDNASYPQNTLSSSEYLNEANSDIENINSPETEISYVAIDIPLNLQFNHKRFIISTGISSLLYIQQEESSSSNIVYRNSASNTSAPLVNREMKNVRTEKPFRDYDKFEFARLLNFSIGYNIPLAKGGLVIEPYLKYPIGTVGAEQLQMGSGGIGIRYNF